jgi:hypothetical protein
LSVTTTSGAKPCFLSVAGQAACASVSRPQPFAPSLRQQVENLAFIVDRAPQPELPAHYRNNHLGESATILVPRHDGPAARVQRHPRVRGRSFCLILEDAPLIAVSGAARRPRSLDRDDDVDRLRRLALFRLSVDREMRRRPWGLASGNPAFPWIVSSPKGPATSSRSRIQPSSNAARYDRRLDRPSVCRPRCSVSSLLKRRERDRFGEVSRIGRREFVIAHDRR